MKLQKNKVISSKTKLYNIEQWYKSRIGEENRKIATIAYQKPFVLARSIKRTHETDITKKYLKGTYFKLVENVQKVSI